MLGEGDEAPAGAVEGVDAAAFDVVDPAVQVQPTLLQGAGDAGVGAQVGQLGDHVVPHQGVQPRRLGGVFVGAVHRPCGLGVVQPAGHRRQLVETGAGRDGAHRAAVRVAADHDVADPEHRHRVFHRGADPAGLRPVAGDDVAGITDHEEFAGLALGQQFGDHPTVRAGDEQCLGGLPGGQGLEQLRARRVGVALEAEKAVDDVTHGAGLLAVEWWGQDARIES